MTRVDFYILDGGGPEQGPQVACRLAEKAFLAGHRVYIHTGDARLAEQLDDLLWTFRQGSFVPHQCLTADSQPDPLTPIHIGWHEAPQHHEDVLINLAAEVPLFFSRFQRVAEVVATDEAAKQHGRDRYRFYRDRGYQLDTHTLSPG